MLPWRTLRVLGNNPCVSLGVGHQGLIFNNFLFSTANLLEPESSDPLINGMVEQLQLIQPQFVERY